MASYTGMSNLQNHPHRSGFDIGRKNAFTAKVDIVTGKQIGRAACRERV